MQKTLDILEKNVQWFVLGLAALFLLWVAYAYVLTPPATIKIGTQEVTPATVSLVVKSNADRLENQIKNAAAPTFPTADLVSNWRQHMDEPYAEPEVVVANKWDSVPALKGIITDTNMKTGVKPLATLPVPPAAILLPPVTGLSTVSLVPPGQNNAAPAPNPNPAQPVAQQTKDTDWIMIPAGISAPALSQALLAPLNGQQPPAGIYNTTLLQVVLERQAVDESGNPLPNAPIEQVPPLTIYQPVLQPLPADSQSVPARFQFVDWAQKHQDLIGGPVMNQVVAGAPWAAPQLPQGGVTAPVTQPAATPAAAPAPPPAPAPAPAPPPAPRAATPKPASNPPRNAPSPRNGTRHYAPYDPARPTGMMLALGDGGPAFNGGQPFNSGNFGAGGNGGSALAQGVLNPFQITNDVLIWAIDETATPGQSYRYRISYKLKNPVFQVANMASQKLIDQLTINSAPSAWTAPIKAPEMTKFWLVDASPSRLTAKVDVFHYSKGSWVATKNMEARPGDQIPGRDLTVVDVRQGDHREKYVLLASDTGEIQRRDAAADAADPDHQTMLAPPNPNGAGPGGPPGNPPGPVGLGR